MSSDQLHTKIEAKPNWALADLLHVLKEEFDVQLRVVSRSDFDSVDAIVLAKNPDVKHTLEARRIVRRMGRVYRSG